MEPRHNIDAIATQLAHGMSLEQMREKQAALSEGRRFISDPTPEQAERLRKYWEIVNSAVPRPSVLNVVRSTAPEKIKYQEARSKVWRMLCDRSEQLGHSFAFTDAQAAIVRRLIQYFINDPECGLDLTKGVYLYGEPGSGKTEIMQILARFTTEHELAKAFHFSNMAEIYAGAIADRNSDPITPNIQFDRCFDDIAMKAGEVNLWGNNIDINEAIIYQRYLRNRRFGQLTHFVSNLETIKVKEILTVRILDRMKDLCQSINYPGASNRGQKSNQ